MTADHPRSRGGNSGSPAGRPSLTGSSPLARGKHPGAPGGHAGPGIIPARAGETSTRRVWMGSPRDHPRSRGGNRRTRPDSSRQVGSSPLARGKRPRPRGRPWRSWIIPACAGETRRLTVVARASGDHPRLRGGNGRPEVGGAVALRIIPACAGETGPRTDHGAGAWDHPRLRGGNTALSHSPWKTSGSSPLARGKRHQHDGSAGLIRIIPACAGETKIPGHGTVGFEDHPRLRGGNCVEFCATTWTGGSSPLARGKRGGSLSWREPAGIIPACAGETLLGVKIKDAQADHPRLRGGNPEDASRDGAVFGSSPLARGKPAAT